MDLRLVHDHTPWPFLNEKESFGLAKLYVILGSRKIYYAG
jgi:hypothetical protein